MIKNIFFKKTGKIFKVSRSKVWLQLKHGPYSQVLLNTTEAVYML